MIRRTMCILRLSILCLKLHTNTPTNRGVLLKVVYLSVHTAQRHVVLIRTHVFNYLVTRRLRNPVKSLKSYPQLLIYI